MTTPYTAVRAVGSPIRFGGTAISPAATEAAKLIDVGTLHWIDKSRWQELCRKLSISSKTVAIYRPDLTRTDKQHRPHLALEQEVRTNRISKSDPVM